MLDFSSSLYLGIQHNSQSLKPWHHLTNGKPSALFMPPDYLELAKNIAKLQGFDAGVISPSTLHLFWDLFGILNRGSFVAFMDSGAYPIVQWGLTRFLCNGKKVIKFKHHQVKHLYQSLKLGIKSGQRPLVITDGWCTHCGKLAPLKEYLNLVRYYQGILIVDDTQALGILGKNPQDYVPYGLEGGGSLQYLQLGGTDIIFVCSLAKAFGVPIAVISGSYKTIDKFKKLSDTFIHSSLPSRADIHAAEHALYINQAIGNKLRDKLFKLVHFFRKSLAKINLKSRGGIFPVQPVLFPKSVNIESLYFHLRKMGVNPVLTESNNQPKTPELIFVLRANHTLEEINKAIDIIQDLFIEYSLSKVYLKP